MEEVIVECKDKIDTFDMLREDIDYLMYTNIYFKAKIVPREIIIPELNKKILYVVSEDKEKITGRRNVIKSNDYSIKKIIKK